MLQLRRSVAVLVVFLAIFFNIERVDFGQTSIINISSSVYILALVYVMAILLWRPLWVMRRRYVLVGGMAIYLMDRLIVFWTQERPMFGGSYTYVVITEASLLMLTIWLARGVVRALVDFEAAVRNLTVTDINHRVQHINEGQEDVRRELLRSRRHNYPLSVLVVEPDKDTIDVSLNRTVLEIQRSMMARYVMTSLIRIASHMLRRSDLIFDQPGEGQFVVLCPDTDGDHARELGARMGNIIQEQLNVRVRVGLATFPTEALTFEDLVERAATRLQSLERKVEEKTG